MTSDLLLLLLLLLGLGLMFLPSRKTTVVPVATYSAKSLLELRDEYLTFLLDLVGAGLPARVMPTFEDYLRFRG